MRLEMPENRPCETGAAYGAFSAAAAAVRGPGGAAAYLTAACYAFSGISSILIFLQYRKLGYMRIPTSPFE
jgi:hypothetical protein